MEHTHIEILKDGLAVGSRKLAKGEIVAVAEISAEAARLLVESKRATPAKPKAEN